MSFLINNGAAVVTQQLIDHYLDEARQAYVSSKEAAARSAAFIYLTWKATLAPSAKQIDKDGMADAIKAYDKNIDAFNSAIDTLKKNSANKEISPEDLDAKPSLDGDYAATYNELLTRVRNGLNFEAKDYRKVKANSNREDASSFSALVKYVLQLDRPNDSSTVSRYVSVVSFLHSSDAAKSANDASELVKLIEKIGGFDRAIQVQRGNKTTVAKTASNKTVKSKAVSKQVKDVLKDAPSMGSLSMNATSAKDGLVVLVGRYANGNVDVIGELPVANMENVLSSYQDEKLFPIAPTTQFLGRVVTLGQLVEEGRPTGRTVNGTTAGEKQKVQRTMTLLPSVGGRTEVMVSALYADASVIVTAVPHHADIDLGKVSSPLMINRDGYVLLEEDTIDIIERRLVTVTAQSVGGNLSWRVENEAVLNKDDTVAVKNIPWTDLVDKFTTPLSVEGFRPKFSAQVNKQQVADVLNRRYATDNAQKKPGPSNEAFDVEFMGNAFSARTLGDVGESGVAGVQEPVSIRCRESDVYGVLTALIAQKTDAFTFEGDPRGLLAVSWSDDVAAYKVFVPSRMSDGGLNPSRIAPLDVKASDEPVAA